jgi:DNA-binding response OmpR family regulator
MRVLVVEDDPVLGELMVLGLRQASYATDLATTVLDAEGLLIGVRYDVMILDLGLPDGNGLDLLRRLAPDGGFIRPDRVLVATARDAVEHRVDGLDAGADDYLVKPFDFDELLARLRALQRRGHVVESVIRVGDLVLDTRRHLAERHGEALSLTGREFALLRYFMYHHGEVLSAEELLEHAWDVNADPMTTVVRVMISRLRKKLGKPDPIRTIDGVGYRLEAVE